MSNKHTQIHPHTLSHTHISVGTLPRFHPSPTLLRAAGALGGFWFCVWWLWVSAGGPAGPADPTAPINHLSSLLFSFLFVGNVDLCLQTLIRSVQRAAPELLTTNTQPRLPFSVNISNLQNGRGHAWNTTVLQEINLLKKAVKSLVSPGEQSEPPSVYHPPIIHHSICSSIIHLQIVPSKPENELLWPDFVLLVIENWEMRTYTSRSVTSRRTGKRGQER